MNKFKCKVANCRHTSSPIHFAFLNGQIIHACGRHRSKVKKDPITGWMPVMGKMVQIGTHQMPQDER